MTSLPRLPPILYCQSPTEILTTRLVHPNDTVSIFPHPIRIYMHMHRLISFPSSIIGRKKHFIQNLFINRNISRSRKPKSISYYEKIACPCGTLYVHAFLLFQACIGIQAWKLLTLGRPPRHGWSVSGTIIK